MPQISRTALVPFSAEQMYQLVNDVKSYPDFLPGCTGSRVLELGPTQMTAAVDVSKAGITGFCWGGRITWLYAAHNPQVKAGVAWYGRIVGQQSDLTPNNPIDIAGQLHGPVLGLYGAEDQGIPQDTLEQMRKALAASGNAASKASEIHVYDGAGHAFHADYRPSYRKAAADDGWQRMQAWFKRHGL